jgi:creatinine amidohydrolase
MSSRHPAAWIPLLSTLTTDEVKEVVQSPPTCVLWPVGSVEPHGPHLPLSTDTAISEAATMRAALRLAEKDVATYVAPTLPYGVTEFASGFAGAIGVPPDALTAFVTSVVGKLLADGWSHVCIVNNHLEPAHDKALRDAVAQIHQTHDPKRASLACPLTKRWARTLSEEFKRGDCHAGRYETSLAIAAGLGVRDSYRDLPKRDVSLSVGIQQGKSRFVEMGMDRAYTGAPAEATGAEGVELLDRLVDMIVGEVTDALGPLG